MQIKYPPSAILLGALLIALLCAAAFTTAAVKRPSLGVMLTVQSEEILIAQAVRNSALIGHVGERLVAVGKVPTPFFR